MFVTGAELSHASEIHEAVKSDDLDKVRVLLNTDPSLVSLKMDDGVTPLYLAVSVNNPTIARLLIAKGANVNAVTSNGYTPLHWAAYKNAAETALILLKNGASTSMITRDGYTPLHLAVSENAPDVLKAIITETSAVYSERFLEKHLSIGDKVFRGDELKSAQGMLLDLLKKDPTNQKLNFAYGLTCYAVADYSRAKMTFERMLIEDGKNSRARLELARTYMAAGQRGLARQEFNAVLATNPPKPVADNIKRTLKKLDKAPGRWSLNGRIDLGAFNDDNVNVGPDSEVISISPIVYGSLTLEELIISSESQPAEVDGLFLSIAAAESFDAGKPGNWALSMNCAYYQNWMDGASEHESAFYQLGGGVRNVGKKSMLMLPMKAAHISDGGDALVNIYGIAPRLLYVAGSTRDMHWLTTTSIETRDYDDLNDRDGYYFSLGETLKNYFGEARHYVSMGLNIFHDKTDSAVYEHVGIAWNVGANLNLTKSIEAYGRLRYTRTDYEEKESLAPQVREDTQDMVTVGLSKKINDSWSVDATYQTTQNDSTYGLYQYDRSVITIRTSLAF